MFFTKYFSIAEMKAWSLDQRQKGKTIGFVPTMGALHEGHLSLVRIARQHSDTVVVRIFVNPLQFAPHEDLDRYPKTLEKDVEVLKKEGVAVVFIPKASEMYSTHFQTVVEVTELSKHLCGNSRPGHFRGVATVVLKLFQIVNPHIAIFGDKDFQQRLVIARLVKDLGLEIKILAGPIVREADGLAMSSRNQYLSLDERKRACVLYEALTKALTMFQSGERNSARIIMKVSEMIDKVSPTHVDYMKICDAETLEEVWRIQKKAILAVAVYFNKTRLIDNVILSHPERSEGSV